MTAHSAIDAPLPTAPETTSLRILHLIASADPEHGGPIENAKIMAAEHARRGHRSSFVTIDSRTDAFLADVPHTVYASGPGLGNFGFTRNYGAMIEQVAPDYDVAVVHGLWNHASMGGYNALRKTGLPWVIYPHGMMDPYFRRAKPIKHWLKQAFWSTVQGRVLSHAEKVLFTCQEEAILARGVFRGHEHYKERVVAYCSEHSPPATDEGRAAFAAMVPALGSRDYLLYLSRIHPKKACDQLIEAFARIAPQHPGLDLVMAGPDQTHWIPELKAIARRLGVEDRIHWPGMVRGAAKAAAYAGARAFVLPSHQENFGIVVAEALSARKPVLISNQVNIWREIEAGAGGIVRPDTVPGTIDLLESFLALDEAAYAAMCEAAHACYERHFSVRGAADDLEDALHDAIATGAARRAAIRAAQG